jgi:predicted nucleic acid binding AN1-type Zn finger protein
MGESKIDTIERNRHECEFCGETKNMFMFDCKRCGMHVCVNHRIPELHNCLSVTWEFKDNYTKHFLNDYAMPGAKSTGKQSIKRVN